MSGTKITNSNYLDNDWQSEIISKNLLKKGFYNLNFNLDDTLEPVIAAGSSVDIDGVLYIFEADEAIIGTEVSGINYIKVYDDGGVAVAEYTQDALPEWDQDKLGYYSGSERFVLIFKYDGTNYYDKNKLDETYLLEQKHDEELFDVKSNLFNYFVTETTSNETRVAASDGVAGDFFGFAVSIDGDYMVAGAPGDDSNKGAAYVFRRTGTTTWDSGTKIVASDGVADDTFGGSVSIYGDYIVVGALGYDSNKGAAYVFHRTGTNTWDSGTKIVASDGAASDDFGRAVSIYGDYIVVGAYKDDSNKGAAYVFRRTGTNTWDSGTKIVASDGAASDDFGWAVSIDGDYIVVGAYRDDSDKGAAYVFHRTGATTWDAGTKIVASDGVAGDFFGYSVSIDGDYIIVGKRIETPTVINSYIFHRIGTNTWDAGTKIFAQDAPTGVYSVSVNVYKDYAAIGDCGNRAVHLFKRIGENSWSFCLKITSSLSVPTDKFGESVAIGDNKILIGADGKYESTSFRGSAYIYRTLTP